MGVLTLRVDALFHEVGSTKKERVMRTLTATMFDLPGVMLLQSVVHKDERGSFTQSWQADDWRAAGLDVTFVQDNLVWNARSGTLRGLHWQREPHAQSKAIQCVKGALLDVVADVRPESPFYGKWIAVELKAGEGKTLFIPAGYAHGYVTTEDDTIVLYKVDQPWVPDAEESCRWNDPTLDVDWRCREPIISEKDAVAPFLKQ